MTCSCENRVQPNYPETDSWGPVLWAILHALANKSGSVSSPMFREDEKRQWTNIINGLPKIIPCPSCREHAEAWLLERPCVSFKTMSPTELHDWLVDWFYLFHESVNARLGKPPFDVSLLSHTYGSVSVAGALIRLKPFIESAIRLSGLTLFPWQKWLGHVKMLNSLY